MESNGQLNSLAKEKAAASAVFSEPVTTTIRGASTETDTRLSANASSTAEPLHARETDPLLPDDDDMKTKNPTSLSLLFGWGEVPPGKQEVWWVILLQVVIPFLIAGMGSVAVGVLLDYVSNWRAFKDVPEFLALVTPLLGLKGNLMMASASRLSTLANLNQMETLKQRVNALVADLFATQLLSIVAGFLASLATIVLGIAHKNKFDELYEEGFLLCATAMLTSSLSASVLGIVIFFIIFISTKVHINPDNVATPLAASLGDISTLAVLAGFATVLNDNAVDKPWLCPVIIGFFALFATPVLFYLTYRSTSNMKVLNASWPRLLVSMMILSCGGIILEITSRQFEAMELYQPIINGVGGSLVSVQASRLSTYFHVYCKPGQLPPKADLSPGKMCQSPAYVFFKAGINSTAARVLLSLVIPGHLIFLTVTYFVTSNAQSSPLFVTVYLGAAIIQVASLLYLCQIVVNVVWFRKGDPDLFAIPVMTAVGDLFGTVFLYIGLEIQNLVKHI